MKLLRSNVVHRARTAQVLYGRVEDIWGYVSRPRHLEHLCPPWMKMQIQNQQEFDQIHLGLQIRYKIRAMPFFPIEVTDMVDQKSFVYRQRVGPYTYWRHFVELRETEQEGAVELIDEYENPMPFGPIGEAAHALFVGRLLSDIREYRRDRLAELFAKPLQ